MTRRSRTALLPIFLACMIAPRGFAYPLDGYESTGIKRLDVQRMIQEGELKGKSRPPGELLPLDQVDLRLLQHRDLELPEPDPTFTQQLASLLGPDRDRYGVALLDLSDLGNVRYAEWRGSSRQNPGSVGKLLVALAIFQALADIHPDDIEARKRILRDTIITADIFSVHDHHTVGVWEEEKQRLRRTPIEQGLQASFYTYLDWMMSPSSNSAAAMLEKNLILLAHFGKAYPPSEEEAQRFFDDTPRQQLSEIFGKAIQEPVTRNGLDIEALRQGSFFTREGKKLVPGTSSYATARELMRLILRMEQGRLVDEWSSREIKRLLYITERRIRYASSGVLRKSAVYFKSGSLYSCEPEEGFTCTKYHGNKRNYMNSAAIVESPAGQSRLYYATTVLSNVLRKNSAQDHRDLARAVQSMLLDDHPPKPLAEGETPPSLSYGEGFIGYQSERASIQLAVDIQEALIALGYQIGEIDGVIGRGTRGAIQKFQTAHGLSADGKPSSGLLRALRDDAQAKGLIRPD